MNDYSRIARVIEYLDERYTEQPNLEALATSVGLRPSHFHRLFSNWAAVTPKDFVECLTFAHVQALLRRGHSVLEAAMDAGLSGPGRLHDLCVKLEAASPGEIKSGGAGTTIHFGFSDTPFGTWLAAQNSRGICHLSFVGDSGEEDALTAMRASWPQARFIPEDRVAASIAASLFQRPAPAQTPVTLRAFVRGTPFQVQVWRALLQIPQGALTSYGRLARLIGHPSAARAVGTAVGQNPLAYLIPCHRVIRETGVVRGYRWGDTRKKAILVWDTAPRSER